MRTRQAGRRRRGFTKAAFNDLHSMSQTLGGAPSAACSFDAGTPYAIEDLARSLMRLTREGIRFAEAMSTDRFFKPQGDRWSPAEHVRHLTKSTAPLLLAYRLPRWALRLRFGVAREPSRTFEGLRQDYLATLGTGGQAGRFAPSRERAVTDPALRRAAILEAWRGGNERLVRLWGRWRAQDLDRALLAHPLLGKLTAREMAIFTVYHSSHHLSLIATRS